MRRRSLVDIVGPKGTASAASVRVCFLPYWYYRWGCQEAITYFNVDAIMNVALYLMTSSSWYRQSGSNGNPRYEILFAINQWPWFGPHYHPFDIAWHMTFHFRRHLWLQGIEFTGIKPIWRDVILIFHDDIRDLRKYDTFRGNKAFSLKNLLGKGLTREISKDRGPLSWLLQKCRLCATVVELIYYIILNPNTDKVAYCNTHMLTFTLSPLIPVSVELDDSLGLPVVLVLRVHSKKFFNPFLILT